jgi:hypothetical protein
MIGAKFNSNQFSNLINNLSIFKLSEVFKRTFFEITGNLIKLIGLKKDLRLK